ncbi:uncharacterized protein EV420DRAFT_1748318 [Desarmillaria tabescens]|uniref:Uncharacterized protein n=1 Tax=Armillaria tabescens TaxID=1929756 RepID=A0AA39KDV8_ARMTA|nr:uncharacterized protein EV420DRAFT_1748318 [Desarmillaria tabescens]KAK0457974.1 hypothetical protein EV420DRAFT_1748318 [Desarmillaria tabescens]
MNYGRSAYRRKTVMSGVQYKDSGQKDTELGPVHVADLSNIVAFLFFNVNQSLQGNCTLLLQLLVCGKLVVAPSTLGEVKDWKVLIRQSQLSFSGYGIPQYEVTVVFIVITNGLYRCPSCQQPFGAGKFMPLEGKDIVMRDDSSPVFPLFAFPSESTYCTGRRRIHRDLEPRNITVKYRFLMRTATSAVSQFPIHLQEVRHYLIAILLPTAYMLPRWTKGPSFLL